MGGESTVPATTYGSNNTMRSNDSQTVNYGGVTVNFHMPKDGSHDVKAIANEVRRVLSSDNIRQKAVNS
jgi:undecaprenyl pyrophosphate synthase